MSIAKQKTLDLDEEEEKQVIQNSQNSSSSEEIWAKLTSIAQSSKPDIFTLKDNKITIGRNTTNTICIPDKRLSGLHCEITKSEGNNIEIIDHSTNGTFVNNEKV